VPFVVTSTAEPAYVASLTKSNECRSLLLLSVALRFISRTRGEKTGHLIATLPAMLCAACDPQGMHLASPDSTTFFLADRRQATSSLSLRYMR
jgi:hypothetical protein